MELLWLLSGAAAWVWIMCRNNMVSDYSDRVIAAMMLLVACIGGPFWWLVVAYSEYEGPIQ